jgi:hypothetical protein
MDQPTYNFRNIRKLLTAAFSDEELRQLCYDLPQFRPIYEKEFSTGMSKGKMIQQLLEYCDHKGLMAELLTVIREEVPDRYAEFAGKLRYGEAVGKPSAMRDPETAAKHIRNLVKQKTRRLHALQEQEALYGISTPPEIRIQIEDLEAEIVELKEKLNS